MQLVSANLSVFFDVVKVKPNRHIEIAADLTFHDNDLGEFRLRLGNDGDTAANLSFRLVHMRRVPVVADVKSVEDQIRLAEASCGIFPQAERVETEPNVGRRVQTKAKPGFERPDYWNGNLMLQ